MAATSNYGNNYPPSNGYAPYNPAINRGNDFRGGEPQQRQQQYAEPMGQPRNPQDSNPYYNNNFQYNKNISRDSQRNLSTDRLNRAGMPNPLESDRNVPSNRNYPENVPQDQYQGNQQENLQPSNLRMDDPSSRLNAIGNNYLGSYGRPTQQQGDVSGPVWGNNNFGGNPNHNRIRKEYQEYVKSYDSNKLASGGRPSANNDVGPYGEDKNRSPLRRKKEIAGSTNQGDSWYIQNYNIGILPGMGGPSDNRRPNKLQTFDPKALQNRPVEQYEGRPGTYESYGGSPNPMDAGQGAPVGSRLAGIGSRLLDNERSPYQRPDQLRIPQDPQDYGTRNNPQSFQTPQYALNRNHTQAALQTPQYNKIGYDSQAYPGGEAQDNGPRDIYGTNWLVERTRQEEDKKQKQRDELQRIYREQIEEKNRKKEDEKRRKFEEERREEERLRKENEDLNRQYLAEQQQKKQKGAPPQQAVVVEKPQKQVTQFETSADNPIRGNVYEKPPGYENDPQLMRIEDVIKASATNVLADQMRVNPRYELYSDPELNVHRAAMKKLDFTLDEQLEKMRRDLEVHSNMIKNQMSAYKTQAVVSQELRQNAQRDLMRLREDLRNQQLQEERRPYEGFELTAAEQLNGKGKQSDKVGLRIPMKNYTKLQGFEDEGEDLGASQGYTLDVETAYVPVRRPEGDLPTIKETHGLTGLMTKHGLKDEKTSSLVNDAAMHKFGQLFPEHKNQNGGSSVRSDVKVENSLRSMDKALTNHSSSKYGSHNQARHGDKSNKGSYNNLGHDDEDHMQRIDGLLDTYQDKDAHTQGQSQSQSHIHSQSQSSTRKGNELPVRHEEKTQKHHSVNQIHEEIEGGEEGDDGEEYIDEEYDHEQDGYDHQANPHHQGDPHQAHPNPQTKPHNGR